MVDTVTKAMLYYEASYTEMGVSAQRRYPNEELCRFVGSNWLNCTTSEQRSRIKVLEVGCGSCANLWMLAHEGFDSYGLDLSKKGLQIGRQVLEHWGVEAQLSHGSMTDMPYESSFFDAIVDVFSAYCLCVKDFTVFLGEVQRVLKPGGKFFFYTPSTASDAYKQPGPNKFIDKYTFDGLKNKSIKAFFGQDYPFRFFPPEQTEQILSKAGLELVTLNLTSRTYGGSEYFEFVVVEARKC
jgi:ubiquinone/menaquinone biosynthesis C-methylase UbiE